MNEQDSKFCLTKEDALDILDRTIGFVNSCESKASIILGIFGVLLTILFSSEGIIDLKNIIKSALEEGTSCGIFFNILLICTFLSLCFGIFTLLKVFFPKTNCDDLKEEDIESPSRIFFDGVCQSMNYKQYKSNLINCSDEDFLNDIISQIYLNSIICQKKFNNYKKGLLISVIGFISFIFIWGLGILIY